MSGRNRLLIGDALDRLRELPDELVDCIVTSPPYFGLRDYGVKGQFGQEASVRAWAEQIIAVCRELHRVLAPHGSLWLNLGDAYSTHPALGAPAKSLLLGPERVAQALVSEGWLLRNKVVWAKTNPMPSPIADRLTNSHEFIYLLVKQSSYYFDLDAIREPLSSTRPPSGSSHIPRSALGRLAGRRDGLTAMVKAGRNGHPLGKNPGDVWQIGSASYRGAHFATFPPELIRRPILATCPPQVCDACDRPWRRSTRQVQVKDGRPAPRPFIPCGCQTSTRPGLVLDPFFGSGTVALVAKEYGRDWLGIELNLAYKPLAEARLGIGL
jgi:site-specific DNA-methyltransferase (adenine-specific)